METGRAFPIHRVSVKSVALERDRKVPSRHQAQVGLGAGFNILPKPVTNPPSCGGCGKPTYQARVSSTIMIGKVPNEAYATLQAIPMTHHPDHVCKKPQSSCAFNPLVCEEKILRVLPSLVNNRPVNYRQPSILSMLPTPPPTTGSSSTTARTSTADDTSATARTSIIDDTSATAPTSTTDDTSECTLQYHLRRSLEELKKREVKLEKVLAETRAKRRRLEEILD
ncbi:hypothetical protein VTP01DRAFT_3561, partial [Rhizomucor pusillus]|uniref:uncharacterized protein n=1 Tax=Rhizomucor pusillus TaxID=4840 RepID=UPI0037427BD9